jgi:hypothetical protein
MGNSGEMPRLGSLQNYQRSNSPKSGIVSCSMVVPPKIRTTLKSVNHFLISRKRRLTPATTIVVIEIFVNIILNKDAGLVVFPRAGAGVTKTLLGAGRRSRRPFATRSHRCSLWRQTCLSVWAPAPGKLRPYPLPTSELPTRHP